MTTKQVAELYFQKVKEHADWQQFIGDEITFESPSPTTHGKEAYVTAATRFFSMAETLEVKQMVTEGDKVNAWVDYALMKNGKRFNCLVCELLQIRNDKIILSSILFDTATLRAFTSQN